MQIKSLPSNLLTSKVVKKKSKGNWKNHIVGFMIPKTMYKIRRNFWIFASVMII